MLEAGIVELLASDATVGGLVGARIYDVIVPDDPTYPCIGYQVISAPAPDLSVDNKAIRHKNLQIDCYDSSYQGAKTLAAAVIRKLEGYSGTLADADATQVKFIDVTNEQDGWDSSGREYRVIVEIEVQYK